jgi:hypothetical protein
LQNRFANREIPFPEAIVTTRPIPLILLVTALIGSSAAAAAQNAPRIYTADANALLKARDAFRAGDETVKKTVEGIIKEADKALGAGPFSVVFKEYTPPSGDKHDYMSLSPYWWPDPSKPDGKPYIRKDGQFNPERAKYDLEPMDKMTKAVDALATAYFFTGDEKYAKKAGELMRAWFIDESTRMNPNLKFAQFVPGYDKPRPSGIIEGGRFRRVVDADGLLAGSQHWSSADSAALKSWFGQLLQYIRTSEQGRGEIEQANNHGSWVHVQMATYALFTGQDDVARELLGKYKELVDSQIKPDGTQPEELARTQSFHYSRYNLLALIELATLGDHLGMDLWNYKTDDGRSLRTAIDYLLPYAVKEKDWPHEQITPIKYGDMVEVLRRAANAYDEPKYEAAAKKIQQTDPRPMTELLWPSKLKQ